MDIVAIILTMLLVLALPVLALRHFLVRSREAIATAEMPLRPIVARYSRFRILSLITSGVGMSLTCLFVAFIKPAPPMFVVLLMYFGVIFFGTALPIFGYRFLFRAGDVVVTVDDTGFRDSRISPDVIPWRAVKDVIEFRSPKLGTLLGFFLKLDEAETASLRVNWGIKLETILNAALGFRGYSVSMGALDIDVSTMLRAVRAHHAAQLAKQEAESK
jgi:hypothetical protein